MAVIFPEQARSLLDNDAFLKALTDIREAARDALCAAEPTEANEIRDQQAIVKVVDDIRQSLMLQSNSGRTKPPGIA